MKLYFFDFDGTLYQSPSPDKKRIDKILYKELLDSSNSRYWFSNLLSLAPEYTENIGFGFFDDVSSIVKQNIGNKEKKLFLLTGRLIKFYDRIKYLCEKNGLLFDDYLLSDGSLYTNVFKIKTIDSLINKFNATEIYIYDDNYHHIKKFKNAFMNDNRLKYFDVVYLRRENIYLPENLENEIIQRMTYECF